MSAVMKASEFVKKLEDVAKNYKTLYVLGCFGAPMNSKNKTRYCNNNSYNKQAARTKYIQAATADTFGFDCSGLLKGILWGWYGNKSKTYGGAVYEANGVSDTNANGIIKLCSDISTDFSSIEVGEAVWIRGHIGVYIGNGYCVEAKGIDYAVIKSKVSSTKWVYGLTFSDMTYNYTNKVRGTSKSKNPYSAPDRTLHKGDEGKLVKWLQWELNEAGYMIDIDGIFGQDTFNAVKKFQKSCKITVDGIVGKDTKKHLKSN